jgi:hypothetical protein
MTAKHPQREWLPSIQLKAVNIQLVWTIGKQLKIGQQLTKLLFSRELMANRVKSKGEES